MFKICGECGNYHKMPFNEDICILTGKVVPYLAEKECFEPRIAPNDNKIADNANKLTPNAMETKVCKDCGRELPIEQFGKSFRSKDGYNHICRECKGKRMKGVTPASEEVSKEIEKAVTRAETNISSCADSELVAELRARGWEVTCRRVIEL